MNLEQTVITAEKKVVLPYAPTKEYEVESLGKLQPKPFYDFVKRCGDIVLSAFLLLLLACFVTFHNSCRLNYLLCESEKVILLCLLHMDVIILN